MLDHYKKNPRIRSRTPLSRELQSVTKWLMITLSTILVISLMIFFVTMNLSAQKGYHLQQIQTEKEKLLEENKFLNAQLIDAQTSNNFLTHPKLDQMIKPGTETKEETETE